MTIINVFLTKTTQIEIGLNTNQVKGAVPHHYFVAAKMSAHITL
jgi:hypothetical protein